MPAPPFGIGKSKAIRWLVLGLIILYFWPPFLLPFPNRCVFRHGRSDIIMALAGWCYPWSLSQREKVRRYFIHRTLYCCSVQPLKTLYDKAVGCYERANWQEAEALSEECLAKVAPIAKLYPQAAYEDDADQAMLGLLADSLFCQRKYDRAATHYMGLLERQYKRDKPSKEEWFLPAAEEDEKSPLHLSSGDPIKRCLELSSQRKLCEAPSNMWLQYLGLICDLRGQYADAQKLHTIWIADGSIYNRDQLDRLSPDTVNLYEQVLTAIKSKYGAMSTFYATRLEALGKIHAAANDRLPSGLEDPSASEISAYNRTQMSNEMKSLDMFRQALAIRKKLKPIDERAIQSDIKAIKDEEENLQSIADCEAATIGGQQH
jgi:hypothetical protein